MSGIQATPILENLNIKLRDLSFLPDLIRTQPDKVWLVLAQVSSIASLPPLVYLQALKAACTYNQREIALKLLEHPLPLHKQFRSKETSPLHYAVIRYWPEIAELLLKRGCSVHVQDERKISPLYQAVEKEHFDLALMMLKHPSIKTHYLTLRYVVSLLLKSIKSRNNLSEDFALLLLDHLQTNHLKVIVLPEKLLLSANEFFRNLALEHITNIQDTLLHCAVRAGKFRLIERLLAFMDPFAKNLDEETPVSIAKKLGYEVTGEANTPPEAATPQQPPIEQHTPIEKAETVIPAADMPLTTVITPLISASDSAPPPPLMANSAPSLQQIEPDRRKKVKRGADYELTQLFFSDVKSALRQQISKLQRNMKTHVRDNEIVNKFDELIKTYDSHFLSANYIYLSRLAYNCALASIEHAEKSQTGMNVIYLEQAITLFSHYAALLKKASDEDILKEVNSELDTFNALLHKEISRLSSPSECRALVDELTMQQTIEIQKKLDQLSSPPTEELVHKRRGLSPTM